MNVISLKLLPFLLVLVSSIAAAGASIVNQQPLYSQVYDPKRNAFDDGRAALELAKQTNRRVMIEVGGDWCVYCHIFDRFIKSDKEVAGQFFDTFVLLKVNYSDENTNKEFLSNFKGIDGYPYIFITESNGKVIYANDMREMTIKGKPSKEKMLRFLNHWRLKKSAL
jgi:thiol:disulfide interchange protein